MNTSTAFIILTVAALIHASFQLGTSMLTLLSSHTIGRKKSHARLLLLTNSFVSGVLVMTILLVSFCAMALLRFSGTDNTQILWVAICGISMMLGISVWLFYYRKEKGTSIWIPRAWAAFLTTRTKKATHSSEAFSLGMSSVIGELLFLFAPLLVAGLALIELTPALQLAGVTYYGIVSSLSLVIVSALVGSGHSISRIQKWRETNKGFLQFAAGSGLLVLGFYLYVNEVAASASTIAVGGM